MLRCLCIKKVKTIKRCTVMCWGMILSYRGRPSSVHPFSSQPCFLETRKADQCQIWWKGTYPPCLILFLNLFFLFLMICFICYYIVMGVKVSNDISSEGTHQIDFPIFTYAAREGSTKVAKRISKFGFWPFSFSWTWDHMGVKGSNISSESTHQIHSQIFSIQL